MASNVKFKRNPAGYKAIMRSSAMASVCHGAASRMASSAGTGYASDVQVGASRVHARAYTTTNVSRLKEIGWFGPLKRAMSAGRI